MAETYHGQIMEIGGPELGKTGNEKPRKVVISDKPDSYKGKTFRLWSNNSEFDKLVLGQWTTVEYETEERQGGPSGSYKQHVILAVQDSDGAGTVPANSNGGSTSPAVAGTPAPSDTSSWGQMPTDTWSQPQAATLSKDDYWTRKEDKDEERNRRMAVAWAIGQAISLGHKEPDAIHSYAHQLLVLQDRMVSELSE